MGMSDYLENKLIDFIFRGVQYIPSENLYVALCTTVPEDSDSGSTISEISGGNYSRVKIPCLASSWYSTGGSTTAVSNGSNGRTGNAVPVEWNNITWQGTVIAMAICDSPNGGNMLVYGELTQSKTIIPGNSLTFLVNQITYTIDD
jgi:hypothetical protein